MNILIDDDKLIRMSWVMAAKKANVQVRVFESVDEFIENAPELDKDSTRVFIDSDLGNGLKGEIEAEKIYQLGFKNIHMATGHSADDLDLPDFIVSVQGKKAPF